MIAFALQSDPRWPVVLAGNRDERHDRPTEPLHRWRDAPSVLAGRDLSAGGSWLGVSEAGRIATVTNVRGGVGSPETTRPSRGWLVRDLLVGQGAYATPSLNLIARFNPVNAILITRHAAEVWANAPTTIHRVLPPGLYGLGNGQLDEPAPRVTRLKSGLMSWLTGDDKGLEPLMRLLAHDESLASDDGAPSTPIFIRNPVFGTRCSTVVRVNPAGAGEIVERRYDAAGVAIGETSLSFVWG